MTYRKTRPGPLQMLFCKRGTMAKIIGATKLKASTVSNWTYIPDRHLKAVSQALGVAQKLLPRKP